MLEKGKKLESRDSTDSLHPDTPIKDVVTEWLSGTTLFRRQRTFSESTADSDRHGSGSSTVNYNMHVSQSHRRRGSAESDQNTPGSEDFSDESNEESDNIPRQNNEGNGDRRTSISI